jgi:hypothetical protein
MITKEKKEKKQKHKKNRDRSSSSDSRRSRSRSRSREDTRNDRSNKRDLNLEDGEEMDTKNHERAAKLSSSSAHSERSKPNKPDLYREFRMDSGVFFRGKGDIKYNPNHMRWLHNRKK